MPINPTLLSNLWTCFKRPTSSFYPETPMTRQSSSMPLAALSMVGAIAIHGLDCAPSYEIMPPRRFNLPDRTPLLPITDDDRIRVASRIAPKPRNPRRPQSKR